MSDLSASTRQNCRTAFGVHPYSCAHQVDSTDNGTGVAAGKIASDR